MAAFYRSVHVGGETGIPPQPNPDFIFFKAQKGQQGTAARFFLNIWWRGGV